MDHPSVSSRARTAGPSLSGTPSGQLSAPRATGSLRAAVRGVAELLLERPGPYARAFEQLILGHFSSRYSPEEITIAVKDLCEKYAINIPVRLILPGETVHDLLGRNPVNL